MQNDQTIKTWGYRRKEDGEVEGQIFDLAPGEALPQGFVDSPAKCADVADDEQPVSKSKKPGK